MRISGNKDIKNKIQINLITESIYNTSISRSQNSLFSKSSEKSEENRKNIIKTKYQVNNTIKETKEFNLSNTLEQESIKNEIDKKDFQEDKLFIDSSKLKSNFYEIQKDNNNQPIIKPKKNKILDEKEKSLSHSLNKIYITIEGSNKLEINPNSLYKSQNQRDVVNRVKNITDSKMGKTLSGYPKIVTNNGERIIYSSHPVFKQQKFVNYTNPNIVALNYSIHNLYEKKNKINKEKNISEKNSDITFRNKQLLSKLAIINDNNTDREKKASFNIFKNANISNNIYLSQKNH